MATLEERIQNLTQDINPMGAMSDMDRKIAMNAMPRQQSAAIMDMVGKTNGAISNREMEMFRNASPSMGTSGGGMGAISDREMEIFRDTMPSNPMQPLVEMGFGEQVDIILGNPADSDISRQAQQQIINEMGTGMDIDSFLMEVNNLAPKGAMTNIDAEGMQRLMSAGRDGDTAIGHLTEGEVVIPAPVLEANPQAANMLEQTMTQMGIDPRTRVVDSTGEIGGIASINPETGFQEFGFLSDVWKKAKKVVKKAAPILPFIPGIGPALSGIAGAAGTAITTGLSKIPIIGGALSGGASAIGNLATSGVSGIQSLLGRSADYDPATGSGQSAVGRIEDFLKGEQREEYSKAEINEMLETMDPSIVEGIVKKGKITYRSDRQQPRTLDDQGGMGMMGKLGIAGLAGLIGKLAYEEAKNQKGVPLTPLTQMDQLGRYNIEAEIARRTGAEAPSRVEFGLNPEGMPALSGGRPTVSEAMVYQPPEKRMMAQGGIMNLNGGGSTGFAERMEVADKLIDSLIPTRKETGAAINEDERNLLNRYSIDRAVEAVPFVPNFIENLVQSDKYKDFESATMDFITPALRHESGAAITYDEINAMKKSLIPMPGDREEVIEAKSMARKNIINKMRSMNSDTQEPNKTKVFAPQRRYDGGIMNLNMGGMPRYNYGGGVQYFNQGGTVAMAEGGDMDATIKIENFPVKDGQIDGPGTEVSDDIPAMLSDGEFVMTAKAVKGAGSFNINDNNGILTLTPNGDPSRDSGTRVMYKLMEHFGKVA
jgi:hypothetical protein